MNRRCYISNYLRLDSRRDIKSQPQTKQSLTLDFPSGSSGQSHFPLERRKQHKAGLQSQEKRLFLIRSLFSTAS